MMTMTRDDILQLDGVELDAACVEYVLGREYKVERNMCFVLIVEGEIDHVFCPSSDMNDAEQLLDHMMATANDPLTLWEVQGDAVRVRVTIHPAGAAPSMLVEDRVTHKARAIARAALLWAYEKENNDG